MTPTLSIIVATTNRKTLARALESCQGADEVIVACDGGGAEHVWDEAGLPGLYLSLRGPHGDFGAAARNTAMLVATGDYLAFLDDDDYYLPDGIASIRRGLTQCPDVPLIFRMERPSRGDTLWQDRVLARGNVSTQMFVTPNVPEKLGFWTSEYAGDWAFIRATIDTYRKWGWFNNVIAVWGRE